MTAALAALLLIDDERLQVAVARQLAHLHPDEILHVLSRIEEYRLACRPRVGQHPLLRAVTVAVDSIKPLSVEVRS